MPRGRLLIAAMGLFAGMSSVAYADWPTVHSDPQRSGFTKETVVGPFERKWCRDFHDEMIASRCEAIVAEGKVYVGTFSGNLYALDALTGETVWKFAARGRIGASPTYHDGRVYVGSDDAFHQGTLYCLHADTGKLAWQFETAGGIWASPACDRAQVYVGDRSGIFYALRLSDGMPAWSFGAGGMILKPASLSVESDRIVVASENMHVYCLSPDGTLLWRSAKLPGLSLRDQGPTIWQGLAIVRTNPADGFHRVLDRNGQLLKRIQESLPKRENDQLLLDKWGDLLMHPTPERRAAETSGIVEHLKENPHDQCFFAFDLRDGSQPWIAPVLFTSGLHNPPTAPTFDPASGELFTLSRTALTHYVQGVRRYTCVVRLNRDTGLPDWFWPERDEKSWQQFPLIPDETQSLSLMGESLIGTHQGMLAALDPKSGDVTPISATRDTYAGIFGPGALPGGFDGAARLAREGFLTGMPNEWHGPDRGIVSISNGRMYWIAGSQVVCLAGPDGGATPSGGTKPPEPFKSRLPVVVPSGNVADEAHGGVEVGLGKRQITPAEVSDLPAAPPSVSPAASRLATELRKRLDAQVRELIAGDGDQAYAPLVIQLGIGNEERYFWRTGETIQVVSRALPHLSDHVRKQAIDHLDRLWESGAPLKKAVHDSEGARREPFDLGPGMQVFARRMPAYDAGIHDLYAVWSYAHFADRWEQVVAEQAAIRDIFDRYAADVPAFDPDDMQRDSAQRLNGEIAGLIGAVRIFERIEDCPRSKAAQELLARHVSERVDHERVDRRLIRPTRGESGGIHQAKVPRYVDLVPELAMLLADHAGRPLERNVRELRTGLPLWHHAYGERMIGGENYISPAHLSRGLFMAWAEGLDPNAETLATFLDQPWCKADLHYIEKLVATLRRLE
jgi:outer membrane protein assembly factor BamB